VGKKKLPKGWTEGTVQEFLGLSDSEAAEVERRVGRIRRWKSSGRSKKLAKTVADAHRRYGKMFKRLAE